MESDEELLEDEEEILVYVEFEGLVDSNVFSERQLQLDMIGIDTEHPIMQINGKFYEGTYEDAVGTYMFFDNDDNPVVDDPVFDVAPTLKYLCKTRKFLRMQRIFVESRTEVLGDSEHDRCVPNLDTIKQAGIPFRYQDEALSFWKTMRNDRRSALHSYLEKQRVRQELKSQGVKLESESDEDNPFAVYKHKEEAAADLRKPEEPSVVSEKEQLTSLDNRISGISENATHSEQMDDESFDNAEATNAGEKLDEDAASSESKASTCKSNESRLTAPVKGYKTKVSPRNKPLASHVKQTIKAKAKGTPEKSTKPLSQHASEKESSDSEMNSDKGDERNVAESSSDRCA